MDLRSNKIRSLQLTCFWCQQKRYFQLKVHASVIVRQKRRGSRFYSSKNSFKMPCNICSHQFSKHDNDGSLDPTQNSTLLTLHTVILSCLCSDNRSDDKSVVRGLWVQQRRCLQLDLMSPTHDMAENDYVCTGVLVDYSFVGRQSVSLTDTSCQNRCTDS